MISCRGVVLMYRESEAQVDGKAGIKPSISLRFPIDRDCHPGAVFFRDRCDLIFGDGAGGFVEFSVDRQLNA